MAAKYCTACGKLLTECKIAIAICQVLTIDEYVSFMWLSSFMKAIERAHGELDK